MTHDLDRLRELWRLAALAYNEADDDASRREEGKRILLDSMVLELCDADEKLSAAKAERLARTSTKFRTYLATMHGSRRKAQDLRVEMADAEKRYYACVNSEANQRAEMRLTGMGR